MRMLDLFCGRFGWSKAFAARRWECVGVDIVDQIAPDGCKFVFGDVLNVTAEWIKEFGADFICASSPCEEFSVHGMKHFHPNPKYPEIGIKLFNHTRAICEESGVPYIMENVRAAQAFVGQAVHHCGPFYLWGSGVPTLMPQGITKNWESFYVDANGRKRGCGPGRNGKAATEKRGQGTARAATIPEELANAVVIYAEAILKPDFLVPRRSGLRESEPGRANID